jgi:hypothetical protein
VSLVLFLFFCLVSWSCFGFHGLISRPVFLVPCFVFRVSGFGFRIDLAPIAALVRQHRYLVSKLSHLAGV